MEEHKVLFSLHVHVALEDGLANCTVIIGLVCLSFGLFVCTLVCAYMCTLVCMIFYCVCFVHTDSFLCTLA